MHKCAQCGMFIAAQLGLVSGGQDKTVKFWSFELVTHQEEDSSSARYLLVQSLLLSVMLFKDALINVMVRRLPNTPKPPNPGLASQSSSPSHRCRERGLLLLGGFHARPGRQSCANDTRLNNAVISRKLYSYK